MKFYRVDGQVVLSDKALTIGEELIPNTTDAAGEKHVPVVSISNNTVNVKIGSVEHPSLPAHYIEWILLDTDKGIQTRWLKAGMKPEAVFHIGEDETVLAAFEYCNLHGLWKTDVQNSL